MQESALRDFACSFCGRRYSDEYYIGFFMAIDTRASFYAGELGVSVSTLYSYANFASNVLRQLVARGVQIQRKRDLHELWIQNSSTLNAQDILQMVSSVSGGTNRTIRLAFKKERNHEGNLRMFFAVLQRPKEMLLFPCSPTWEDLLGPEASLAAWEQMVNPASEKSLQDIFYEDLE